MDALHQGDRVNYEGLIFRFYLGLQKLKLVFATPYLLKNNEEYRLLENRNYCRRGSVFLPVY